MFDLSTTKKKKSALTPIKSLQSQVDNIFNDFFNDFEIDFPSNFNLTSSFQPKVNIAEDKKSYQVEVELAGVDKKDITLKCENNILSIWAEKKEEETQEKKNYYRVESSYGSYQRSLQLPANASEKDISADFKNGILKIKIAKTSEAESKAKNIEIK